ncbi:MAG: LON peptidase substrate-binding domain-containing protein, partial [Candidatus Porifericomitaceae bacterium WSBS_2022_MAG_OTU9]
MKDNDVTSELSQEHWFPMLPLRDVVVFPHMVIPLFVGRDKSVNALQKAMHNNKQVVLTTQKKADVDEPGEEDLYSHGTLANILQMLKLPDGTLKVLIEGVQRVQLMHILAQKDHYTAQIMPLDSAEIDERESEIMVRSLLSQFEQYA